MNLWKTLTDLVAPRPCLMCGERLSAEEDFVCKSCLAALPRTHFYRNPYENLMAQMFWGLMPVERTAAWFYYAPATRTSQLIHHLKYYQQPHLGTIMGQLMACEYKACGFFDGIDAIIPIPLTKERHKERGYNQSAMIAQGISLETGIPVDETAVSRLHFRQSQTRLDRWARLKNVEQQFLSADAARFHGKHLLLTDDVVTTGATIIACASALQPKLHDIRFSVLTLGYSRS